MELLEIFKAARELIIDPAHWTQGQMAAKDDGTHCDYNSPEASCFCLYGALVRVSGFKVESKFGPAFYGCLPADYNYEDPYDETKKSANFIRFNDQHSHADVIQALDCAIAKLEAK